MHQGWSGDWRSRTSYSLGAAIAHEAYMATMVLILSRYIHTANRGLKLDERVSAVVLTAWQSFASGTEVGIGTDCAFVAGARNVRLIGLLAAKWAIAIDAKVTDRGRALISNESVESSEPVAWVSLTSSLHTTVAVVKVRTVQALVAYTVDSLVAAIADGIVTNIAARCQLVFSNEWKHCLLGRSLEAVCRVVAMSIADMALDAQVEVLTGGAGDEISLWQNSNAIVASTGGHFENFGLTGDCDWHLVL